MSSLPIRILLVDGAVVVENPGANTTAGAKAPVQEEQRQAGGSSRTGGSSSVNTTGVRLELHEIGKHLAEGVTFQVSCYLSLL